MSFRTLNGAPPKTKLPAGSVDTQMHMYLSGYPADPSGIPLPTEPPGPAEYRELMNWLGLDRVIVTQANAHGRDNSNLLACLRALGDCARGVAVITDATTDRQMVALSEAGVVGARLMDLPGGAVGLDQLEAIDARAAAFNWYVAIQFNGSQIALHESRLSRLRSRWVLDHHGKFFAGARPHGPEVKVLKRLIDGGNCWFKFAGCYESSLSGGPDFADVAGIAREIARYSPERVVWGTNWPHNQRTSRLEYPNDAELLDLVMGWLPDDGARHLALVENPSKLTNWTVRR